MEISKSNEALLDQTELHRILDYDFLTGIFRWKINKQNIKLGAIAGSKNFRGYIRIGINGKDYRAHRLAWLYMVGEWPSDILDHEDRNPSNNKFSNLRLSNSKHNLENQNMNKTKKWKAIPGVYFDPKRNYWNIRLNINGKSKSFGSFFDKDEAEEECKKQRRIHYPGNII
jgi:hypothetical protein